MAADPLRTYVDLPEGYRANAGVVLINPAGLVFAGRRKDQPTAAWQMPQGGIDSGEAVEAAALRELAEETGVQPEHVEVLGLTPGWAAYDLPPDLAARMWKGRYRGQGQRWLACRMLAADTVVDLEAHTPEFDAWQWFPAGELMTAVIDFKRPIYRYVFDHFGAHLTGWSDGAS